MASSAFTVQDGSLAAVASGNGQNVTPGNTTTCQLTDMTGVTGYSFRSIWNNQGANDLTLSNTFTANQTTGAVTIPTQVAGTAMIVQCEVLQSTLIPSTPRTYAGLYWRGQGQPSVNFAQIPSPISFASLQAYMQTPAYLPFNSGNYVTANNVSTIVIPAGPSNYFFASALLKVQQSGLFRVDLTVDYTDSATADTVTYSLITDTSAAGVLGTAGTKAAVGVAGYGVVAGTAGNDLEIMTAGGTGLTYNGAAFTTAPIVQKTSAAATLTGVLSGLKWSFNGVIHNAIGTTRTPFLIGNTVAFGIKVSATSTITVNDFCMFVQEL